MAGSVLEVRLPSQTSTPSTLPVTIPPGLVAGDTLRVQTGSGEEFDIEVPEGCVAGSVLEVRLPSSTPLTPLDAATDEGFTPAGAAPAADGGTGERPAHRAPFGHRPEASLNVQWPGPPPPAENEPPKGVSAPTAVAAPAAAATTVPSEAGCRPVPPTITALSEVRTMGGVGIDGEPPEPSASLQLSFSSAPPPQLAAPPVAPLKRPTVASSLTLSTDSSLSSSLSSRSSPRDSLSPHDPFSPRDWFSPRSSTASPRSSFADDSPRIDAAAATVSRALADLINGPELEMSVHVARAQQLFDCVRADGGFDALHAGDGVPLEGEAPPHLAHLAQRMHRPAAQAAAATSSRSIDALIALSRPSTLGSLPHKSQTLLKKLVARVDGCCPLWDAGEGEAFGGRRCGQSVMVLGGGPIGLRTAIEMALLGHRVQASKPQRTAHSRRASHAAAHACNHHMQPLPLHAAITYTMLRRPCCSPARARALGASPCARTLSPFACLLHSATCLRPPPG